MSVNRGDPITLADMDALAVLANGIADIAGDAGPDRPVFEFSAFDKDLLPPSGVSGVVTYLDLPATDGSYYLAGGQAVVVNIYSYYVAEGGRKWHSTRFAVASVTADFSGRSFYVTWSGTSAVDADGCVFDVRASGGTPASGAWAYGALPFEDKFAGPIGTLNNPFEDYGSHNYIKPELQNPVNEATESGGSVYLSGPWLRVLNEIRRWIFSTHYATLPSPYIPDSTWQVSGPWCVSVGPRLRYTSRGATKMDPNGYGTVSFWYAEDDWDGDITFRTVAEVGARNDPEFLPDPNYGSDWSEFSVDSTVPVGSVIKVHWEYRIDGYDPVAPGSLQQELTATGGVITDETWFSQDVAEDFDGKFQVSGPDPKMVVEFTYTPTLATFHVDVLWSIGSPFSMFDGRAWADVWYADEETVAGTSDVGVHQTSAVKAAASSGPSLTLAIDDSVIPAQGLLNVMESYWPVLVAGYYSAGAWAELDGVWSAMTYPVFGENSIIQQDLPNYSKSVTAPFPLAVNIDGSYRVESSSDKQGSIWETRNTLFSGGGMTIPNSAAVYAGPDTGGIPYIDDDTDARMMGSASAYPSVITVSGIRDIRGANDIIEITLNGFSHEYPSDVIAVLVNPAGKKLVLFGCLGTDPATQTGVDNIAVANVNLTICDVFDTGVIPAPGFSHGRYLPTFSPGSSMSLPSKQGGTQGDLAELMPIVGPTALISDTPGEPLQFSFSAFRSYSQNGDWKLYVWDYGPTDTGSIVSWGIRIIEYDGVGPMVTNRPALWPVVRDTDFWSWSSEAGPRGLFCAPYYGNGNTEYQETACDFIYSNTETIIGDRSMSGHYSWFGHFGLLNKLVLYSSEPTFTIYWSDERIDPDDPDTYRGSGVGTVTITGIGAGIEYVVVNPIGTVVSQFKIFLIACYDAGHVPGFFRRAASGSGTGYSGRGFEGYSLSPPPCHNATNQNGMLEIPHNGYCITRLIVSRKPVSSGGIRAVPASGDALSVAVGVMRGATFETPGTFIAFTTVSVSSVSARTAMDVFWPVIGGAVLAYQCATEVDVQAFCNFQPGVVSKFNQDFYPYATEQVPGQWSGARNTMLEGYNGVGLFKTGSWWDLHFGGPEDLSKRVTFPISPCLYNDTAAILNLL